MKKRLLFTYLGLMMQAIIFAQVIPTVYQTNESYGATLFMESSKIKVGIGLSKGAGIVFFADKTSSNTVNNFDQGRQIQQSYYAGPEPFSPAGYQKHGGWAGFPWNPVQAGDAFNNVSDILVSSLPSASNNYTAYFKTQPRNWSLNNHYGDCYMESWYRFDNNDMLEVRYKITTFRQDGYTAENAGPAQEQAEAPAMWLNRSYNQVYLYRSGDDTSSSPQLLNNRVAGFEPTANAQPGASGYSVLSQPQYWFAVLNNQGVGLGWIAKNYTPYQGGNWLPFNAQLWGTAADGDFASTYVNVSQLGKLYGTSTMEYSFYLTFGTLNEIMSRRYENSTPSVCDFTVSTSSSTTTVSPGASVTLNGSCSGQCSGVSYSWSGNGISGTNSSVTFNAPSTAGTYTYTLTGSKSGCTNQSSNITVTVAPPGGGTTCVGLNDNCSGNSSEITSSTVTVSSAGSYEFKLTYRAHEVSPSSTGRIRINGGAWQNITLPYAPPNVYIENVIGNFNLNSGNNTVELNMVNGHQCYRQLCVTGGSGGCSTPAAPLLSASPSTITTPGGSSTLTASGCPGGIINWSDGLGSGTSKTVTPPATKTYTATCSIGSCTSSPASVTVNVNTSGGGTPVCVNYNDNCSGNSFEIASGTVTVSSTGSYQFKLTYRAHEVSPSSTGRIRINGGSWQNITLPYAPPNVYVENVIGNFNLNSGNNTVELNMVNGHQCYRQLCVQPAGSPAMLEPADELNAPKQLAIYPNPAKGVFETSFYLEKGKRATIIVSDMQGRTIHRQTLSGHGFHKEKINVNNKATGTLLVQLIKESGIEVKKVSVIR